MVAQLRGTLEKESGPIRAMHDLEDVCANTYRLMLNADPARLAIRLREIALEMQE